MLSASFAITMPLPSLRWTFSRIWSVLEPGAAHMSRTMLSGCTSRNMGGSMLTASWRPMWPERFSAIMYWWSSLNAGILRSFLR